MSDRLADTIIVICDCDADMEMKPLIEGVNEVLYTCAAEPTSDDKPYGNGCGRQINVSRRR